MVVLVSVAPVDGGVYQCDWNKERKLTMVKEVDEVARNSQAAVALLDRALGLGLPCRVQPAVSRGEAGAGGR